MRQRLCVVMPALDEAEALPTALAGRPKDVRIVLVDNGSADATAEVARGLGVEVVTEPRRGFGAACRAGLAAGAPAEVVVFMDADGSLDWADLPAVTRPVLAGEACRRQFVERDRSHRRRRVAPTLAPAEERCARMPPGGRQRSRLVSPC